MFRAMTLLAVSLCFSAFSENSEPLKPSERLITILSTNDIHGGVEPTPMRDGPQGGMALWSGVAKAIRTGLEKKHPGQVGVVTLDAGDQFQGTLISNFDEGQLVFAAMNEVGYTAVVPGNHDYDFGPIGWLEDQGPDPKRRREALLRLVKQVSFPLISANTFYTDTIRDTAGKKVKVENMGCTPEVQNAKIDWTRAKAPQFLKSHLIVNAAGVRVALIGIDHPHTPSTTTFANVEDLCFGDSEEHYRRVRKQLDGKADVFVLVIHNGNAKTDKDLDPLVEKLTAPERLVDAVISGHTHFTYGFKKNGVPVVQSGYGGIAFGRVDLVWDAQTKSLVPSRTRFAAGLRLMEKACDRFTKQISDEFCTVQGEQVSYEGVEVAVDDKVKQLIAEARERIKPIAGQHLGHAHKDITRDRIKESALSNEMTDTFRAVSKAEISTMNTGGLRDIIKQGDITYEDLFKVLPFANHGVIVGPLSVEKLIELLDRSIKTCGTYGALMQSGLRVQFRRNCATSDQTDGLDPDAHLVKVEMLDGTLIYENGKIVQGAPKEFTVATLDFLSTGGSGFTAFKGVPVIKDLDILRETMKEHLLKHPADFKGDTDGRWKNLLPDLEPERR